jgi:REP element-mobilizing transposase RayT
VGGCAVTKQPVLTLKVSEALSKDMGRAFARMDPEDLKQLAITIGDIVQVEGKKRFGLCVLNYTVTSNHIHLLVYDCKEDVIPKSIQLIAGRTAREYNIRKNRTGAVWEDRYHATAVHTDEHFIRCLAYIDLNIVRAHPEIGKFGRDQGARKI